MTTVLDPPVASADRDEIELDTTPSIRPEQLAAAAVVIAAMTVAATWGFRTIFSSAGFLTQSVFGATVGALVVLAAQRWRLLFGEVLALSLLVPVIAGPIASGGLGYFDGIVTGWTDIITASPPVDLTPELRALPFSIAFFGALIGVELARARNLPGLGVVGPLAALALTALFSEQTRGGALTVGLVLLVGLLVLARLHHARFTNTGVLLLAALIALVSIVASTAGFVLGIADEDERFDLRELQTPPWDPLALPSPLSEVKAGLKQVDEPNEQPILRVTGAVPATRWRLASLPTFNGVYWSVADADTPAEFVSIDSELPAIEDEFNDAAAIRFDVDVLAALGPWVPSSGVPIGVDFRNETDARMSTATGTIGVPARLQVGDSYALTAVPWIDLDDAVLADVTFVPDDNAAELELLPPVVRNLAADFSTGMAPLSGRRVLAIRDNLALGSYDAQVPPGHSFGRIAEFLLDVGAIGQERDEADLRPLAAYEELYSATGAVLARLSDIPARVAVGYVIPDERWQGSSAEIFASDMSAWIEVRIDGVGWMPIDVTPDRSREPQDVEQNELQQGAPVPDPPQPPPAPDDSEAPEITEEEEDEPPEPEDEDEEMESNASFNLTRLVTTVALTPIIAFLLIAGALIGWKAVRRRRRRLAIEPTRRVIGAWTEFLDRANEAGADISPSATPTEAVARCATVPGLDEPLVHERAIDLADRVSTAAFHPVGAGLDDADAAWDDYDMLSTAIAEASTVPARARGLIDPRPLLDDPLAGAGAER